MIVFTYISIVATSVLMAIGIYFAYVNLLRWKEIDHDTVRARVFLDKSFLTAHFILLLVMGGITVLHILIDSLEILGIVSDGLVWIIYEGGHVMIMLNLVLITYLWYILLHRKQSNA